MEELVGPGGGLEEAPPVVIGHGKKGMRWRLVSIADHYGVRGAVIIPNHEILLRELRGLERRTHRSGKDSVDHGDHGSDDFANAVCGAMYIAQVALRRPKMRQGAIDTHGVVHWRDDNKDHSRIFWARPQKIDRDGNPINPPEDPEEVAP